MPNSNPENLDAPGLIRTYTGKYIDPFNPNPDLICIEDIAHALSKQCRFAGHTKSFYSVAEHSIFVCMLLPVEHRLAGLLHDAAEAYLVDVPTPVKNRMPEYKQAEEAMLKVIAEKFGFEYPLHPAVKEADRMALLYEWAYYVTNDGDYPFSNVGIHQYQAVSYAGAFIELFQKYWAED